MKKFLKLNIIVLLLFLSMANSILGAQNKNEAKVIEAVLNGNLELVSILLDEGVNPNTQNVQKKPLLYLATERNNLELVDLLLKKGALVDFPFDDKNRVNEQAGLDEIDPTPFLYAGAHGQTEIINRLIREKPNLEIRNYYGGNALIPAAEKGHYETAKLLLEKTDIDVNFINFLGWTALLEVVILSKDPEMQVKMAKLLLEHGADILIEDKDGVNALGHAKKKNNNQLIILLKSHQ